MRIFLPNETPWFFYLILRLLQVNFPTLHPKQKAVPFWQYSLGGRRWWTVNSDATRQPTWTKKLFFLFFHVWPPNLLPQSRFCSHYTPVPLAANILMGLMAHFHWYSNMYLSRPARCALCITHSTSLKALKIVPRSLRLLKIVRASLTNCKVGCNFHSLSPWRCNNTAGSVTAVKA